MYTRLSDYIEYPPKIVSDKEKYSFPFSFWGDHAEEINHSSFMAHISPLERWVVRKNNAKFGRYTWSLHDGTSRVARSNIYPSTNLHTIIEYLGKHNRRVSWTYLNFDWCHYITNWGSCYQVEIYWDKHMKIARRRK